MLNWKAKVHKAGSKVAIFQNDKLIKVIASSEETFKPAEAAKFAQELLEELEYRYACDLDTSDVLPIEEKSIDAEATKTEEKEEAELEKHIVEPQGDDLPAGAEKSEDTDGTKPENSDDDDDDDDDEPEELPAEADEPAIEEASLGRPLNHRPDGTGPYGRGMGPGGGKADGSGMKDSLESSEETKPEAAIEVEAKNEKIDNLKKLATNLKGLLEKERNERDIERRARRGLAIAKQMVANGDLEDDYDIVRAKVAEIVDLDEKDIEITERKTAGISAFDTSKEAKHEARRQRRLARITTIAAEDAQHEGDAEEADRLDVIASQHAEKAAKYEELASKMDEKSAAKPEGDIPAGQPKDVGFESDGHEGLEKEIVDPQGKDLPAGVKGAAKKEASEKITTIRAKIADVRLSAEASEAIGDTKTADEYDTQADELEQEAELLEAEFEKEYAEPEAEETEDMKEPKPEEDETAVEEKAVGTEFFPEDKVKLPTEPTMTESSKEKDTKEAKKNKDKEDETKKEKEDKVKKEKEDKVKKEKEDKVKKEKEEALEEKKEKAKEKKEKKDASMIDGFGFDKSAAVVEQNNYSGDSEVGSLEKMWNGKPDDVE